MVVEMRFNGHLLKAVYLVYGRRLNFTAAENEVVNAGWKM